MSSFLSLKTMCEARDTEKFEKIQRVTSKKLKLLPGFSLGVVAIMTPSRNTFEIEISLWLDDEMQYVSNLPDCFPASFIAQPIVVTFSDLIDEVMELGPEDCFTQAVAWFISQNATATIWHGVLDPDDLYSSSGDEEAFFLQVTCEGPKDVFCSRIMIPDDIMPQFLQQP